MGKLLALLIALWIASPAFAQSTGSGGGATGACAVSGTANQAVTNTGTAGGCQSSATTITTGGAITDPVSPGVSTSALQLTGTVLTGGSGTTNFPHVFVNAPGATASTNWSTSGTAYGANMHSFSGNLLDLQIDGTTFFFANAGAAGTTGAFSVGGSSTFGWSGRATLTSPTAASTQLGAADAAAPVAQTLRVQSVVAGTSNTAGAATIIDGSVSTGSGVGGAVTIQTSPPGAAATVQNTLVAMAKFDGNGHLSYPGTAPVITSCGTGSPSVSGSDIAGTITIGTTATACTLTFKVAYAASPHCVLTDQTALVGLTSYTISASAIVLTLTSNSGNLIDYACYGA